MYLLGPFYLTNGWRVRVGRLLRKLFFWGTSFESSTCQEVSGDQHEASNPLYEANLETGAQSTRDICFIDETGKGCILQGFVMTSEKRD